MITYRDFESIMAIDRWRSSKPKVKLINVETKDECGRYYRLWYET